LNPPSLTGSPERLGYIFHPPVERAVSLLER
jgi:hypothetical protein